MSTTQSSLEALESQCSKLEESHRELQRTIYHWREQEAEYDGLKTDVAALDENCTQEDIIRVARQYGGPVVTDDEIKLLTGEKQGVKRNRQQVESAITRRIDYVHENLRVLEKRSTTVQDQLQSLQDKISDLSMDVNSETEQQSENLPITDIVEHLDDNGNIISSTTKTPEQDAPKVLAALKEAGVDKLLQEGLERRRQAASGQPDNAGTVKQTDNDQRGHSAQSLSQESSEDIKPSEAASEAAPPVDHNESIASSTQSTEMSVDSTETDITDHTQNDDEPTIEDFEMPGADDTPEEAALRREILRYGMEEVGAVVAELEMDTDADEVSVDEDYDEDYNWSDEDEEEDEYGRSTKSFITDEYRAQMEELEKKLNIKDIHNVGPNPDFMASESKNTIKPAISHKDNISHEAPSGVEPTEEAPKKKAVKKKVAFADDLDIAPERSKSTSPPPSILKSSETAIKDEVIERSAPPDSVAPPTPTAPKRLSRFKATRKTAEPAVSTKMSLPSDDISETVVPGGPVQHTPPTKDDIEEEPPRPLMADKLIEREPSLNDAAPPDPDDFDEALHRQEINTEFYRLRNRKIAQEGGFTKESMEETQTVPLDEDENGQPTAKLSRFMAARIRRT